MVPGSALNETGDRCRVPPEAFKGPFLHQPRYVKTAPNCFSGHPAWISAVQDVVRAVRRSLACEGYLFLCWWVNQGTSTADTSILPSTLLLVTIGESPCLGLITNGPCTDFAMTLSAEALVAIIGIIIAFPPTFFLLWGLARRRRAHREQQEYDLPPTRSAQAGSPGPRLIYARRTQSQLESGMLWSAPVHGEDVIIPQQFLQRVALRFGMGAGENA